MGGHHRYYEALPRLQGQITPANISPEGADKFSNAEAVFSKCVMHI